HGDISCSGFQMSQPGAHGILPALSARNRRSNLFEFFIAHDRVDFIASILAGNDNNSIDRVGTLERAYCMSDDWFAGNRPKPFIVTHAEAVTSRDNDCGYHGKDRKPRTPNTEL